MYMTVIFCISAIIAGLGGVLMPHVVFRLGFLMMTIYLGWPSSPPCSTWCGGPASGPIPTLGFQASGEPAHQSMARWKFRRFLPSDFSTGQRCIDIGGRALPALHDQRPRHCES